MDGYRRAPERAAWRATQRVATVGPILVAAGVMFCSPAEGLAGGWIQIDATPRLHYPSRYAKLEMHTLTRWCHRPAGLQTLRGDAYS